MDENSISKMEFSEMEQFLREELESKSLALQKTIQHGKFRKKYLKFMYVFSLLCLMLGLWILSLVGNSFYLRNRMLWHTKIGIVDVGGMTISEAREALRQFTDTFYSTPVVLLSSQGTHMVSHANFAPVFDADIALSKAFQRGHSEDFWKNQRQRLASIFHHVDCPLPYEFDPEHLVEVIHQNIPTLKEHRPEDASIKRVGGQFVLTAGKDGMGFNENKVIKQYENILSSLSTKDMVIDVYNKAPDIDIGMAKRALFHLNRMLYRSVIMEYSYDGYNFDTWSFSMREVKDWIEFKKIKEDGQCNLYLMLNVDYLRQYLNKRVAKYLYMPKEDITIKNENGKPTAVGNARDGYYLDVAHSIEVINDTLRFFRVDSTGNFKVRLLVAHLEGGIANPNNEFGISEVLATGVTDFFGSPQNRKFNIKHVAEKFQNLVVNPGEKFSFIRYMGKVDSLNGYMKELVIINGDSSEPQYGGGICQVSSTLFRTIFFSGVKILNRVNHSFEVKYYRPVGLDATVFDPAPDLKFENDTKNPILMQNLVDLKRTKMYFKLFGKKDGRKVSFDGPIYEGEIGKPDSTGSGKKEYYKYSWYRYIEFSDGTKKKEKYGSLYRNKDLVKKYQPENLLVKKDSLFIPVSLDTTKFNTN